MFVSSQSIDFLQPDMGRGIAGHAPVAPGTETDVAHFDAIRHAAALKLLGKEPTAEGFQPLFNGFIIKIIPESPAGQPIDLRGRESIAKHIVK